MFPQFSWCSHDLCEQNNKSREQNNKFKWKEQNIDIINDLREQNNNIVGTK